LYEGGVREPLIVRWSDLDGQDFSDVWLGAERERSSSLFWEYGQGRAQRVARRSVAAVSRSQRGLPCGIAK
jgi:hypothetical protein